MGMCGERDMLENNLPRGTRAFPPLRFHLPGFDSAVYFPSQGLRCNDNFENKEKYVRCFPSHGFM